MLGLLFKILLVGAGTAAVVGLAGVIYKKIQERLTRYNAARLIKENLDAGNYNSINIGLHSAKVIDVAEDSGDTLVAFELNDGKRIGLRTSGGTTLDEGDVLTI